MLGFSFSISIVAQSRFTTRTVFTTTLNQIPRFLRPQFGKKYDHNSARNSQWLIVLTHEVWRRQSESEDAFTACQPQIPDLQGNFNIDFTGAGPVVHPHPRSQSLGCCYADRFLPSIISSYQFPFGFGCLSFVRHSTSTGRKPSSPLSP